MIVGSVRVNGVSLELLDEGTGDPVLFSHGGASDVRYWEPQAAFVAAHRRFVAYSRRFHGSGSWPSEGDNSDAAHIDDMIAVGAAVGAGPVDVVGFSSPITLKVATRAPELFRRLIIIEPNIPELLEPADPVLTWWRDQNARVEVEADGDAGRLAALWFELVNNRGPGTFELQPSWLQQMWLDNFGRIRPSDPSPVTLTRELLGTIQVPTLVVGTEYGMPYSRRIVDALTEALPGSERIIVDGVTHFMSAQDPDTFNELILRALNERLAQ